MLRDDVRIARWALEMARLERANVWRYRGANAVQFRRELAHRIDRCITKVRKAQRALSEAEMLAALRHTQEAQPATLTMQQVQLCIKDVSAITSWLDGLSLSKPADDAYHMRLLMRDRAAWVLDLLLSIATRPISIAVN